MKNLEIILPYPPSVNNYWRITRKGVYLSDKAKGYRRLVGLYCLGKKRFPKGDIKLVVESYPPDRKKRDIDNILKALLDSLQHAGVYADDNQICDARVVRKDRIENGQVKVRLELLDAA